MSFKTWSAGDQANAADLNENMNMARETIVEILVAGENLTAGQSVYIKSSDGKAYRTITTSAGEAVENYCGFVLADCTSGNTARICFGRYVTGLSGLTAGATYYLNDTAGVIGTTPGTVYKLAGIALTTTTFQRPSPQRTHEVKPTMSQPASAGTTADTIITCGFRPKVINIKGIVSICDSGGTNCKFEIFDHFWNGTAVDGGNFWDGNASGGGAVSTAGETTSNPFSTPSSGTNRSSYTLSINALSATGVTLRITNTIVAGSGSTNGQIANVHVLLLG